MTMMVAITRQPDTAELMTVTKCLLLESERYERNRNIMLSAVREQRVCVHIYCYHIMLL